MYKSSHDTVILSAEAICIWIAQYDSLNVREYIVKKIDNQNLYTGKLTTVLTGKWIAIVDHAQDDL